MKEITSIPEVMFVVSYTSMRTSRTGQTTPERTSNRVYSRFADVAKAVVDGNAQGPIYRYIAEGSQERVDLGPGARKAADGWTHGSDKRKAVNEFLRSGLPEPRDLSMGVDEVEAFLNG